MTSLLGPGEVALAIDVGGTQTKSALVDASGTLVGMTRVDSPVSVDGSADALIALLAEITQGYARRYPALVPNAVGLSVPGFVDERAGVGVFSSNLGWRNAPIKQLAEQALGVDVAFGHDVRAACLAEHQLGAARGAADAVVITIGTGLSGAIIANGELAAASGYAGEFGHSPFDPLGEACPCGSRGCVERVASASAIARRYRERASLPAHDAGPQGAREVLELAQLGDPKAQAVWDEAVSALALTLARITAFIGPEIIVLGGGLSHAGYALFDPVREQLRGHLSFHRVPEVVPALLGGDAGLLGTALAARELRSSE